MNKYFVTTYHSQSFARGIRRSPSSQRDHSYEHGLVKSERCDLYQTTILTRALADIGALDHRCARGSFAEGDFGHDGVLFHHSPTLDAESVACSGIIFDYCASAIGAHGLDKE